MSSQTTLTSTSTPGPVNVSKLYRVAGIASLVGGLTYLIQPFVVFVVGPSVTGANGYPVAADLVEGRTLAPVGVVEFATIGTATIVLAIAVHRLSPALGTPPGVPATAGLALGVVAGFGWIAAAAMHVSAYGLFATNLAEITPDPVIQQAAIQTALVGTGTLCIAIFGHAGWFIVLGTSGRRAQIIGWPLAIVCLVAAAAFVVPAIVLLVPFGILVLIPVLVTLGITFLVKSRRS